ncbi:hypothetical protein ACMG5L_23490 [Escherichia coli]|uniref:hypothetical protein n=1 Tax=Escherichia coli TaxID=562 RepID=UPI0039BF1706
MLNSTFTHHLHTYAELCHIDMEKLTNSITVRDCEMLPKRQGFLPGSRSAAFFLIAYFIVSSSVVLLNQTKKQRKDYAAAITQVYFDRLHGRAVSIDTALTTAFRHQGATAVQIPGLVKIGKEIIQNATR